MASNLVSPNEIMAAAKEHMLNGNEPTSRDDYLRIVNFLAVNVHKDIAVPAIKLMKTMYDMPIQDSDIEQIVAFQQSRQDNS